MLQTNIKELVRVSVFFVLAVSMACSVGCSATVGAEGAFDEDKAFYEAYPERGGGFGCSRLGAALGLCAYVPAPENATTQLGNPHDGELSHSMRMLVWNVFKGKRTEWDADMATLSRDKHLVLTQEILLDDDSMDTLLELEQLRWAVGISFVPIDDPSTIESGVGIEGDLRGTGVATGATVSADSISRLESEGHEPVIDTPKVALATTYFLTQGVSLLVVNVHAINFVGRAVYDAQMAQIEQRVAAHDGPLIVAGDFNTWSRARLAILDGMIGRQGLTKVSLEDDSRFLKLDHVLVRGLQVDGARIVTGVSSSDHKPIEVELSFEVPTV